MDDTGEEELTQVQNEASNACLSDPKELGLHGRLSEACLATDVYFMLTIALQSCVFGFFLMPLQISCR